MVRILIVIAGGVMLFLAGLVGTLGFRGKLNRESLSSMMGGAHASEDAAATEHAAASTRPAAADHRDDPAPPAAPKSIAEASIAGPVGALTIGAPFSDDETRQLFGELRSARAEWIEQRALLDRERRDLELVRIDMNRRWDDVEARELELQEYAASLDAQRQDLDSRGVLLKEAEAENLQQLAKNVEKMSSESAARMLQENAPERVALILHYVKPRETGKILDAMPQDFAAQVAEKMLGILKPGDRADSGGK